MAEIEIAKDVNVEQLTDEMGFGVIVRALDSGLVQIEVPEVDQAILEAAVEEHVPDPDFGKPPEQLALEGLQGAATEVVEGKRTFTDEELQQAIAALVLEKANG